MVVSYNLLTEGRETNSEDEVKLFARQGAHLQRKKSFHKRHTKVKRDCDKLQSLVNIRDNTVHTF